MNQAELDDLQYVKHVVGLKTYEGWAKPGTPLTAKAWRIKVTEYSENPYAFPQPEEYQQTIKFPTVGSRISEKNGLPSMGFKFSWSEHESLNYSFIKDETPPSLTSVSIASNGTVGPSVALVGDTVTVSIVSNEYISWIFATVAGHVAVATMGEDAKHWTVSTVIDGSEAIGPVTFSVSFSDAVGNSGSVISTTDETSVTFYETPSAVLKYSMDGLMTVTDTASVSVGETIVMQAIFEKELQAWMTASMSVFDGESIIFGPFEMLSGEALGVPGYETSMFGFTSWFDHPTESAEVRIVFGFTGSETTIPVILTAQTFEIVAAPPAETPLVTVSHGETFNEYQNEAGPFGERVSFASADTIHSVTKSADTAATMCYVKDLSGNTLATAPFDGNVATFDLAVSAGTYQILIDAEGANFELHYTYPMSTPYPIVTGRMTWVSGIYHTFNNDTAVFGITEMAIGVQENRAPTVTNLNVPGSIALNNTYNGPSVDVADADGNPMTVTIWGSDNHTTINVSVANGTVQNNNTSTVTVVGQTNGTIEFSIATPSSDIGGIGAEVITVTANDGTLEGSATEMMVY